MSGHRMGTIRTALWTHVGVMVFMLVVNLDGALRLLLEQGLFAIGLFLLDGEGNPERVLTGIHIVALLALVAFLVLWDRDDVRAKPMLYVALGMQALLAPVGIAVATMLWWLRMMPEFGHEEAIQLAGQRRGRIVATWLVGVALTGLLAAPALFMLESNLGMWAIWCSVAALPQALAAWLLLRLPEDVVVMPPLPELAR